MRARALLGPALAVTLLTAGCSPGASDDARPAASRDHEHVEGMDMSSPTGPSSAALMICTSEIGDAVARTFALSTVPESKDGWSRAERVYTCTYQLVGGTLELSVQDAEDDASGVSYFDALRRRLPGATELEGMENLGFPALATSDRVVFLKDGKTLEVDAGAVPQEALRKGYTRRDTAYAVASAVIACWTE